MNEEEMTMGLVSRTKRPRTFLFSIEYLAYDNKWKLLGSGTVPNTDIDEARKEAIRELRGRQTKQIRMYDDKKRYLGRIYQNWRGTALWEAGNKVYTISPNTGRISFSGTVLR